MKRSQTPPPTNRTAPTSPVTVGDDRPPRSSRRLPFVATRSITAGECQRCPVRAESLLKRASLEDLQTLHTGTVRRVHGAGDVLWRETDVGSGAICFAGGHALARVVTPRGDVALARVVGGGWAAGLAELLADPPRSPRIDAIGQVDVCFLPAERLLATMKRSALVAYGAAEKVAQQHNATLGAAYSHRVRAADARVLAAVLALREPFGSTRSDGSVKISLPMSRRDLADLASVTPETLSRSIASLAELRLARFRKREVTIRDVDAATDLVERST